jgi:hypothetical protein
MAKGNEKRVKLIQQYRAVVEKELDDVCGEILSLLDQHLVPSASSVEASVFYLKMKADYHRYLAEFKVSHPVLHAPSPSRGRHYLHPQHNTTITADGGGPQGRRGQDPGGLQGRAGQGRV